MNVDVSIVIPVYNTGEYIGECLKSVQNQLYQNFEAIIVNDGSSDSSYEICCKFAKNDSRFKTFCHETNMGLGAARNTGIKNANGKYVLFLDSDDQMTKDALLNMMNKIGESQPDIVIARMFWKKNNILTPVTYIEDYYIRELKFPYNNIRSQNVEDCSLGSVCGKLYSLSFIRENHLSFMNSVYWEDVVFSYMSWYYAKTVYIDDTIVYLRTCREDENNKSITQNINKKSFTDRNIIFRAIYEFGVSHADDPYMISLTDSIMNRVNKTTEDLYASVKGNANIESLSSWYRQYKQETKEMIRSINKIK